MVSRNGAGALAPNGPQQTRLKGLRLHTKRPFYVIGFVALFVLMVRLLWPVFGPELIINYTHSEPYGVYKLVSVDPLHIDKGAMVAFDVPPQFRRLVTDRGWVNAGHPLMKVVAAVEGDTVCVSDQELQINGRVIGPVFASDSLGRPLPRIRGCSLVGRGQFFPVSTYTEKSFDGRYIGMQPLSAVLGVLEPVWTF